MSQLYELKPELLSHLFMTQKWDSLWEYILSVLQKIHGSKANENARMQVQNDYEDPERRQFIQGFSKLLSEFIIAILSEPKTQISDDLYYAILEHHEAIHTLFYIAGIRDTDALVQRMLQQNKKLSPDGQKKLSILLQLDTKICYDLFFKKVLRKYHMPLVMVFLSYTRSDDMVHGNKISLLKYAKKIDELPPHKDVFKFVCRAFFYVSYIDCEYKHDCKKNMNRYVDAFLKKFILHPQKIREAKKRGDVLRNEQNRKKPVLLVYSEFFEKKHAMYRSWGRRINLLRDYFDVHLVIDRDQYDETMEEDFSSVYICDPSRINEAIYHIYELAPDMVFYPSIGMTSPGMVFSNIRFCNFQGMGLGHPATAMNSKIDFVSAHKDYYSEKVFPMDRVVCDEMPPCFALRDTVQNTVDTKYVKSNRSTEQGVDVTIVGTHFKLAGPYLSFLSEMINEADFKVNLTFLISGVGLSHVFLAEFLRDRYKGCVVKGFQPYDEYLNDIRKSDLMLCPFPFGHSNSVFDSIMLGKPCISLYGEQPHSRTESLILDRAGLKEDFVCKDKSEYKERFYEISRKILSGETEFFNAEKAVQALTVPPDDYDYAQKFVWAYKNAARIKAHHKGSFYPESG